MSSSFKMLQPQLLQMQAQAQQGSAKSAQSAQSARVFAVAEVELEKEKKRRAALNRGLLQNPEPGTDALGG
jgi:hypothetical protein